MSMSQHKDRRSRYNPDQSRQHSSRNWGNNRNDRISSPCRVNPDDYRDKHQSDYRRRSPVPDGQRSHIRPYDERRFPESRYDTDGKSQRYEYGIQQRYQVELPQGKGDQYYDPNRQQDSEQIATADYINDVKNVINIQREINPPIGMYYASNIHQKEFWD